MGLRTPIYTLHLAAGARMADFAGWDMPIHYGSQIAEHHQVRNSVGICDVSHMTVIDLAGSGSKDYLRYLLANDVAKLTVPGKALYSAMLNETGGVLDDVIVYLTAAGYRLVVNCATRGKDLAWMHQQRSNFDCTLTERPELAILAIQGPASLDTLQSCVNGVTAAFIGGLKPFVGGFCDTWFIARTGYTGEKGIELILPADDAMQLWEKLLHDGIMPVGLGARDTLRLEAGMNLYGSDMDESVTPFESNMAVTVAMDADRDFIGKPALSRQLARGLAQELVGLVMQKPGVMRARYPVCSGDQQVGEITSGVFSPTLQHSIALARIQVGSGDLEVTIRNKRLPVSKVKPPFARNGKKVYTV